jgi:hypothetical protein
MSIKAAFSPALAAADELAGCAGARFGRLIGFPALFDHLQLKAAVRTHIDFPFFHIVTVGYGLHLLFCL